MHTFPVMARDLKALLSIAPKHDVRWYFNGVYFDPAGYMVATNGHMLLATRCPKSPGFIMPRALMESFLKKCGTPKQMARLQVYVGYNPDTFECSLNNGPHIEAAAAIDGKFPEWMRCISHQYQEGSAGHVLYDPAYIQAMQDALRLIEIKPDGWMQIANAKGSGAALCTISGRPDTLGIIMPQRGDTYGAEDAASLVNAFKAPKDLLASAAA